MHSSSCGLCFGVAKRSVIYADSMRKIEYAWPSRALSHDDIKLSAAAFRPGRLFRLSRHRDPASVGVCHTVPVVIASIEVESMSCRKKAPSASDRLL